jgi:hypothetical protein
MEMNRTQILEPGTTSRQPVEHVMEILLVVLTFAVVVSAVVWHHHTKSEAAAGVEFSVAEPPEQVARAISDAYCSGTKAFLKSTLSRITVRQVGSTSFEVSTSLGDTGHVEIVTGPGKTSMVQAHTTEFFIGTHPSTRFGKGILGLASWITHGIYVMLGVAPYAVKMKRFQRGLERRVQRQLARTTN